MNSIPYGHQSISECDIEAVVQALKGEYLTTGPLVELFEKKLEDYIGAPCAVVSSGTAALHCAYAAIDLKPGDEIITTPMTFIATQATAALFGARITFADIQIDTGNIDPQIVESLITDRTKAIVAVDFAGHPADLDELLNIAKKYNLYLIEDAAHSIGSVYKDKRIGSIADITTFSFFPTKNMTTAEGGAISSKHPEILKKAKRFARQGIVREKNELIDGSQGPWHQEVHNFGLNYRLPDVLCALGISQLEKIENFKQARAEIFDYYQKNLSQIEEIILPPIRNYTSPMWHLFHIHVDKNNRRMLYEYLRKHSILVQVNYMPAHWHPVFKNIKFASSNLERSEEFYRTEISLPIYAGLNEEELEFVVNKIKLYYEKSAV